MGRMRYGTHPLLEQEANRLLRESMRGITKHSDKADVLTPWKEKERRSREVYTSEGRPDGAMRRGVFHRALNSTMPHLNARDGAAPATRVPHSPSGANSSLAQFARDFRDG